MAIDNTAAMMANPKFQALTRARAGLGWTLAVIMWVIYFGFILLDALDKDDGRLLAGKIEGGTTSVAIIVGLCVLVSAFILTAIYVVVANTKFDAMVRDLRQEVGR